MADFKWPETVRLELLASDFEGTEFFKCESCAVSKAARRNFPKARYIREAVNNTEIEISGEKRKYLHAPYGILNFDEDKAIARESGFDNTVIRTIKLIKV